MDEEPIVCGACCAEPGEASATQAELELEGWDFSGEFGPQCPECIVENKAPSGAGLDAIAEALGAAKKES
jgi:hypothetical protein